MMQPLLNIAISAARQAGDFVLRSQDTLDRIQTNTKEHGEWVSEVDIKSEQIIMQAIKKAYPDHGIIGEETGFHNADAEVVWIIDPLDGTANYLRGHPHFAISIACRIKNKIEHGVILDPHRQECFTASRGRGAMLNDRRIRVSKQAQLKHAILSSGFPSHSGKSLDQYLENWMALAQECTGVRRSGSSALDLAYVAAGRLDGLWQFGLRLWDMAAGVLLIKEAGGLVADCKGSENYIDSGEVVAANPKLLKLLLQHIQPKTK